MTHYEIIIALFEAFVYLSFLRFFIVHEIRIKTFLLIYLLFVAGMSFVRISDDTNLCFFVLSITSIVIFCVKFTMNKGKAFLIGILVTIANMTSEKLCDLFLAVTYHQTMAEIEKSTSLYIIGAISSKLILYILLRIVVRIKIKQHDAVLPSIQWYGVMIVPAISLFMILGILVATGYSEFADEGYALVFFGGLLSINIFSFILYDSLAVQTTDRRNKEHEVIRLQAENKRYNTIIEHGNKIQGIQHDIHAHLKAILSFLKCGEYAHAKEYIQALNIIVDNIYENAILKQYPTVDMVLRQRMAEAKSYKITLNIDINVPSRMPIKPIDLCIILGNALDNAIEYCAKQTDNKVITLEMYLKKNRLILNISNPSGPIEIIDDTCLTTKEDKSIHGYGLYNIRRTVEKYNGYVTPYYEDGIFYLLMIILL